jgi:hypothetical protein
LKAPIPPLLRAAGLALLVLVAGCETAVRTPRSTQTVVLDPDQPMPVVEADVVTNVKFELPGPDPASGLVWEIVSNNVRVLDQTSALKPVVDPAPGAKPRTAVMFYAQKPGKSLVRFVLVQPNQAEAVPVSKCSVLVKVNE